MGNRNFVSLKVLLSVVLVNTLLALTLLEIKLEFELP